MNARQEYGWTFRKSSRFSPSKIAQALSRTVQQAMCAKNRRQQQRTDELRHQRFFFETLEQRLLLSADYLPAAQQVLDTDSPHVSEPSVLSMTASGVVSEIPEEADSAALWGVLDNGLGQLSVWSDHLDEIRELAAPLPLIEIATGSASTGALIDSGQLLRRNISKPLTDYLRDHPSRSIDEFLKDLMDNPGNDITFLSAAHHGTDTLPTTDDEYVFDVQLSAHRTLPALLTLGGIAEAQGLSLPNPVIISLDTSWTFSFSFGVDLHDGSLANENFFIRPGEMRFTVATDVDDKLDLDLRFGFLELRASGGILDLLADATVRINNPDHDAKNNVTLSELTTDPIDVQAAQESHATLTLPVNADFLPHSFATDARRVTISSTQLFNGMAPQVSAIDPDLQRIEDQTESALMQGLSGLAQWGSAVDGFGSLATPLPVLGTSFGTLAPIGDFLRQGLADPIGRALAASTNPSAASLATVLETLKAKGSSVLAAFDGLSVQTFTLSIEGQRVVPLTLDLTTALGDPALALNASLAAPVHSEFHAILSFGVDLAKLPSLDEAFFVEFHEVNAQAAFHTSFDAGGQFGLLELTVSGGQVSAQAAVSLTPKKSRFNAAEFYGAAIDDVVTLSPSGALEIRVPVQAQLGKFTYRDQTGYDSLTLHDSSLFDAQAPVLTPSTDFQTRLDSFRNVAAPDLLGVFQQLPDYLTNLGQSSLLDTPLPLTAGQRLGDLLPLGDGLKERLKSVLDATAAVTSGQPGLQTAQEIVDALGLSSDNVDYDPASQELSFTLDFSHDRSHSDDAVSLGKTLGPLGSVSGSGRVDLNLSAVGTMTLGVVLTPLGGGFRLAPDTLLSALNGGSGVTIEEPDGGEAARDHLQIHLRDGTTIAVSLTGVRTVADVLARLNVGNLTAALDLRKASFVLTDHSTDRGTPFTIRGVDGSLAAIWLGIAGSDDDGDGVIEGQALHGDSIAEHVFLRNTVLSGEAAENATFQASANLGFVGIGIADASAVGTISTSISLDDPEWGFDANQDGRLTLNELIEGLEAQRVAAKLEGQLAVNLPVHLAGAPKGLTVADDARLSFMLNSDGSIEKLTETGLDDLYALKDLSFDAVVNGLADALAVVEHVERLPSIDFNLPLVSINLKEALGFAPQLGSFAADLRAARIDSLQALQGKIDDLLAVHASDNKDHPFIYVVGVQWDVAHASLRLDLHLERQTTLSKSVAVSLSEELGDLTDARGAAPVQVDAGAALSIALGIDFSEDAPRSFLYDDGTYFSFFAGTSATAIDFDAALGPLGVFVRDGSAAISLSKEDTIHPAAVTVGLGNSHGRHYLGKDTADLFGDLQSTLTGYAQAALPIRFPTETSDPLTLTFAQDLALGGAASNGEQVVTALGGYLQDFDLSDSLAGLADGWQGLTDVLIAALKGDSVLGRSLPMIGKVLKDKADFVEKLRDGVLSEFDARLSSGTAFGTAAVQQALYDALQPNSKLPWLRDRSDDENETIGLEDVLVNADQAHAAVEFLMDLGQHLEYTEDIGLDLGLPSLGLTIDGGFQLALDVTWHLGLGISRDDGIYFTTSGSQPEIVVNVTVSTPNLSATGKIGFLQLAVKDDAAQASSFGGTFKLDLNDPNRDGKLTVAELASISPSEVITADIAGKADVHLDLAATFNGKANFPSLKTDFAMSWVLGDSPQVAFNRLRLDPGQFVKDYAGPVLDKVNQILGPVLPIIHILSKPLPVISDLSGHDVSLIDLAKLFGVTSPVVDQIVGVTEGIGTLLRDLKDLSDSGGDLIFGDFTLPTTSTLGAADDLATRIALTQFTPASETAGQTSLLTATAASNTYGSWIDHLKGLEKYGLSFGLLNPNSAFQLLLGGNPILFAYDPPPLELGFSYRQSFRIPPIPVLKVEIGGNLFARADFAFGFDTYGLQEYADAGSPHYGDPSVIFEGFFVNDRDSSGVDVPEVQLGGSLTAGASVDVLIAKAGVRGGIYLTVDLNLHDNDGDGRVRATEIADSLALGPVFVFDVSGSVEARLDAYYKINLLFKKIKKTYRLADVTLLNFNLARPTPPEPPPLASVDSDGVLTLHLTSGDDSRTLKRGETDDTVIVSAPRHADESYQGIRKIVGYAGDGDDHITVASDLAIPVALYGEAGNDVLFGGAAEDTLDGGSGQDKIDGQEGADTILGGDGNDALYGREGADRIVGGAGADTIVAGDGNDFLEGGLGADVLYGGLGNDTMYAGNFAGVGDEEANIVYGGSGDDTIYGSGVPDTDDDPSNDSLNDTICGDGKNDEQGTSDSGQDGGDVIFAGFGNDLVYGGGGNDVIWGGGGDDELSGQNGDDVLHGELGNDQIQGDQGADKLYGEAGDDTLEGGTGVDTLEGGAGNDQLFGADSWRVSVDDQAADHLYGGTGNDTLAGGLGGDDLFGGTGDDTIFAADSDGTTDTARNTMVGGGGNDEIYAGAGDDQIWGDGVNDAQATEDPTLDGADTIRAGAGNDTVFAGGGIDRVWGDAGNDAIFGDAGDDTLYGEDGQDTLCGGAGNDVLFGGRAMDWLVGGMGDDTLNGDEDVDILWGDAVAATGGVPLDFGDFDLARAANFHMPADYSAAQSLYPDVLSSAWLFPAILGGQSIEGSAADGNDILRGGTGEFTDFLFGGGGVDALFGDAGTDYLDAGGGSDRSVQGGSGDDVILAGTGDDVANAGDGTDWIVGGDGDDTIRGGKGRDVIFGDAGNDTIYATESALVQTDVEGHLIFGGDGDDVIYGDDGADKIVAGAGRDAVFAFGGSDVLYASDLSNTAERYPQTLVGGDGDDTLYGSDGTDTLYGDNQDGTGTGDDDIFAYAGADTIYAGRGTDWVVGGADGDDISGDDGIDVLWGDAVGVDRTGKAVGRSDFAAATPASFTISWTIAESASDGADILRGGGETDFLFGGARSDALYGGAGDDYIDAGAGDDTALFGDGGNDVLHGGNGNDVLQGGEGIDQIYGDDGSDRLYGDAGVGDVLQGQRLYGGRGTDYLYAFAYATCSDSEDVRHAESALFGDQLYGEEDGDFLYGNLRRETLDGGGGNDYISGDYSLGPNYLHNAVDADRTGADDLIFGGDGDDHLLGGGGSDTIWGGADSDWLEGQDGQDTLYGGSGIDIIKLDTDALYRTFGERIDGHYGNTSADDISDDHAVDILLIEGTSGNDFLSLSQGENSRQLRVDYDGRLITVDWQGERGPLIEQFRISGLNGNDRIAFGQGADALQAGALGVAGADFFGIIDGGPGDDTLIGSSARDRLDGGEGSDTLYGLAGNDEIWGDGGNQGASTDHDVLYGGAGDDDLIGGKGSNDLLAWSADPQPVGDKQFGVFVDPAAEKDPSHENFGRLFDDDGGGRYVLEPTGLNRVLGGTSDDRLYGGTGLDFLYGNGGLDTLYRADGSAFSDLDEGQGGDAWKAYARSTDKVWYTHGTEGDDTINVFFDSTSERHVVKLTDAGQTTLGFAPWDMSQFVLNLRAFLEQVDAAIAGGTPLPTTDGYRKSGAEILGSLLPPEGDFQAIIVDALAGNDTITVEATVQKTVWIDGGAGDDEITVEPTRAGNAGQFRDVVIGNRGNDRIQGGAGEDWIFGGPGNDWLTGGLDKQARDLIFGGDGDDTFQIIPDEDPAGPSSVTERLNGGSGDDRVLFRGTDYPDHVAIRYNGNLQRYEFTSLIWDVSGQGFLCDDRGLLEQRYSYYQAPDTEHTVIETLAGDDEVHGNGGYTFPGSGTETWGIQVGDFEQRALIAALEIDGGPGQDSLFGTPLNDILDGGFGLSASMDRIYGGGGNDLIYGRDGADTLFGNGLDKPVPNAMPPMSTSTTPRAVAFEVPTREEWLRELARRSTSAAEPVARGVNLSASEPDLTQSFAVQGETGEQLQYAQSLGDCNGDGTDEVMLIGTRHAYILSGPVDFAAFAQAQLKQVAQVAEQIIDLDTLGTPANRMGDINADGLSDLVFFKLNDSHTQNTISIFFGGPSLPRQLDSSTAADRRIVLTDAAYPPVVRDVIAVNWDGDVSEQTGRPWLDILAITAETSPSGNLGFVYSGRAISQHDLSGSKYEARITDTGPDDAYLSAVVAGDVNGDGREDVLIQGFSFVGYQRVYLLGGRVAAWEDLEPEERETIDLEHDSQAIWEDDYLRGGVSLGDLNDDGYAEIGVLRELGAGSGYPPYDQQYTEGLYIIPGSDQFKLSDTAPVPHHPDADASWVVTRTTNTGIRQVSGEISVATGDFNGDRKTDLAVGMPFSVTVKDDDSVQLNERGEVFIVWSLTDQPREIDLARADVVLTGEFDGPGTYDGDRFGTLSTAQHLDLNGDHLDDLLIGAPKSGRGGPDSGTIYAIYGSPVRTALPENAHALTNYTVSGSGSFLVDKGTGRAETYLDESPADHDFELPAGDQQGLWYTFNTLGDGTGDNDLQVRVRAPNLGFALPITSAAAGQTLTLGGQISQELTFEFDIAELMAFRENPQALGAVKVRLPLAVKSTGTLPVWLVTDPDELKAFTIAPDDEFKEIDITRSVQKTLAEGETRLTIRLRPQTAGAGTPLVSVVHPSLIGGSGFIPDVTTEGAGVLADLFDAQGGLLTAGRSLISLRGLAAGRYYFRVYNPAVTDSAPTLPLEVLIRAPVAGFSHETATQPDRDIIFGGDGSDTRIEGNHDRDWLFGESGNDAFKAETIEIRDFDTGDRLSPEEIPEDELIAAPRIDPNPEIRFSDPELARAVAGTLGLVVGAPIYASDLASLTRLDADGFGITHLEGLERAVNLTALDLSNNAITDLSILIPDTDRLSGESIGLSRLNYLSLDNNRLTTLPSGAALKTFADLKTLSLNGNPISDVSPLADMPRLELLSIDDTGRLGGTSTLTSLQGFEHGFAHLTVLSLAGNDIQEATPIISLSALKVLDLRFNDLGNIAPLADEWTLDDGDRGTVALGEDWQRNIDPVTGAYGQDYRFAYVDGSNSAAAQWRFESVPTGRYEVLATWPEADSRSEHVTYTMGTLIPIVDSTAAGFHLFRNLPTPVYPTVSSGRVVDIDTDALTITGDDVNDADDAQKLYGVAFDTLATTADIAYFDLRGDLTIPDDYLRVTGSRALTIRVDGDILIGAAAEFDVSASGSQPGPGGGRGGSGGYVGFFHRGDGSPGEGGVNNAGGGGAGGEGLLGEGGRGGRNDTAVPFLSGGSGGGGGGGIVGARGADGGGGGGGIALLATGRVVVGTGTRFDARGGDGEEALGAGDGGGGAGGMIELSGSVVEGQALQVDAQGGRVGSSLFAPATPGGPGRFALTNNNSVDRSDWTLLAHPQIFSGPTANNPYLADGAATPLLPGSIADAIGVQGRPGAFGLLDIRADALFTADVFAQAPDAWAALIRVDVGPSGFDYDFPGYDLVLFANLSEQAITDARLGLGAAGFLRYLADSPDGLDVHLTMNPGDVFVTLIPSDSAYFAIGGSVAGVNAEAHAAQLENGQILYLAPLQDAQQISVNQAAPPSGLNDAGRPWQTLGTVTVSEQMASVGVRLSGAGPGLVAADAIRLHAIDAHLPMLNTLLLDNNPLDNRAHELLATTFPARGVAVSFTPNDHAPEIEPLIAVTAEGLPLDTLHLAATDADGDPVYFTARSDDPSVHATVLPTGELQIVADHGFFGSAHVTVTAHDGPYFSSDWRGRTSELGFNYHAGSSSAIYGTKFEDIDRDGLRDPGEAGLEGVRMVVVDPRTDATLAVAYTDANGEYVLGDLRLNDGFTYEVTELPPNNQQPTYSVNRTLIGQSHRVMSGIDFGNRIVVDAGPNQLAREGDVVSFSGSHPADGGDFTYRSSLIGADGSVLLAEAEELTRVFRPADNGIYIFKLIAYDAHHQWRYEDKSYLVVENTPPALQLSGRRETSAGVPYRLNLSSTDPGADTIRQWTVDWGDGTMQTVLGNPNFVEHVYGAIYGRLGGNLRIQATATDEDGTYSADPLAVTVMPNLMVKRFEATTSGFRVRFNRAFDASLINLYDAADAPRGVSDVTLNKGSLAIRGSLVTDSDAIGFTFIKSGSALDVGSYTVRLASGAGGFSDGFGTLDGNADGFSGDAYTASFTITTQPVVSVGIGDFMRGPAQTINLPVSGDGLPILLNSPGGVTQISFSVAYDPALMHVSGIRLAAGLPTETRLVYGDTTQLGQVLISLSCATPLPSGRLNLVSLTADVPVNALYGDKEIVDIADVVVNGVALTGADDDSLHVVGYFADTSGNGDYGTLDTQRLQRVASKLDSGFSPYPTVDPAIIADINGDGLLTAVDVARLQNWVLRKKDPAIPERPALPSIQFSGPDPNVWVEVNSLATVGETIVVRVKVDTAEGLESVKLKLAYDATALQLLQVRRGDLTADFAWFVDHSRSGLVDVDMSRLERMPYGAGDLLSLEFRVLGGMGRRLALDLVEAWLNESHLTLNIASRPGEDATDGHLAVLDRLFAAPTVQPPLKAFDPEIPTPKVDLTRRWDARGFEQIDSDSATGKSNRRVRRATPGSVDRRQQSVVGTSRSPALNPNKSTVIERLPR